MRINDKSIGSGERPFIVAEIGGSHYGSLDTCMELIKVASECGADAVKFQCFTPDSITMDCDRDEFVIKDGPWAGYKLYDLYKETHTPREWFPGIFSEVERLGLVPFASVFSMDDANFLKGMDCPIYKISSFEIVDLPLIAHVAKFRKPMFISTGMASTCEIIKARDCAIDNNGGVIGDVVIMHCASKYPASIADYDLHGFHCGAEGISDHTIGSELAAVGTSWGVSVIEKHITLDRANGGPDDIFASNPSEFRHMVDTIKSVYTSLSGGVKDADLQHRPLRRSLYAAKDIKAGEQFSVANVRSIRPGGGLPPENLYELVGGSIAAVDIERGTPLSMELVVRKNA